MAEYTIIKKSGERFRVKTPDDGGRYQVRSGAGYGVGGSPTVYQNTSSGKRRVDNKTDSSVSISQTKPPVETKTASVNINPQAKPPKNPYNNPINNQALSNRAFQQYQTFNPMLYEEVPVSQYLKDQLNPQPKKDFTGTTRNQFDTRFENIKKQEAGVSQQTNIRDDQAQGVYDSIYRPKPITSKDVRLPSGDSWQERYLDYTERFLPELNEARFNEATNPVQKLYSKTVVAGVVGGIRGVSQLAKPIIAPQRFYEESIDFTKGLATGETLTGIGTSFVYNPVGTTAELGVTVKGPQALANSPFFIKDNLRTKGRTKIDFTELTRPEIANTLGQTDLPRNIKYPYFGETPSQVVKLAEGTSPSVQTSQKLFFGENEFNPNPMSFTASPNVLKGFKNEQVGGVRFKVPDTKAERNILGIDSSETQIQSFSPYVAPTYLELASKGGSFKPVNPVAYFDLLFRREPTIYSGLFSEVNRPSPKILGQSKSLSYDNKLALFEKDLLKTQKQGELRTAPSFEAGKPEIELAVGGGQEFTQIFPRTRQEYYTEIGIRKIPLDFVDYRLNPLMKGSLSFEKIFSSSDDLGFVAKNQNVRPPSPTPSITNIFDSPRGSPNVQSTTGNVPSSGGFGSITSSTAFNPFGVSRVETQSPSSTSQPIDFSISFTPSSNTPSSSVGKNIFGSSITYSPSLISSGVSTSPTPSRRRGSSSRSPSPSSSITPIIPSISPSPSVSPTPSRSVTPSSSRSNIFGRSNVFPPSTPRPILPFFRRETPKQAFDVYVRRQGKFFKENRSPLTKQGAINFGSFTVGSDSSATFKLKSVFGKPQSFLRSGNLSNFYRKGNLFIEKKEKRIKRSSPLELAQITYKGIATNKSNSKLKNIFGGSL